jgi:excinuclease ABC subunit C
MTTSALDGIAGLGETRRKALLRHFGSLRKLRGATVEEIVEVPGIGRHTATAVLVALADPAAAPVPAFDPLTGEVLEDDDAATGDTATGDPGTGDPGTGDPVTGDSAIGDIATGVTAPGGHSVHAGEAASRGESA